ncbi:MAG TPA: hypothetical protein VF166_04950 [Gemmatimonadaceae bacterium]
MGAPSRRARTTFLAISAAVGVGLALAIYQPWRALPFDVRDFSEFLPLLLHNNSFAARLHAFTDYYASQGRLNILSYLFLVLKWSVFGWHSAGWQLARFVEMCGIVAGVFLTLRRMGAARAGAVAGAALFIVASTAEPSWTRLTMGEPLGTMAMLGALWLAAGYQRATRRPRDGVAIAILLALALLAKEMFVATVPFVLLVALCFEGPDRVVIPERTARNIRVVVASAIACLLVLVPVAITALRVSGERFAAQYGAAALSSDRVLHLMGVLLLPVHPAYAPRIAPLLFPANLLFVLLVIAGWALAVREPVTRDAAALLGFVALLLPLLGAIAYAPWPLFEDFYGLPFLIASAMLVALAVTYIERYAPRGTWAAYAACVVMLGYSATTTQHAARASAARQEVNDELSRALVANAYPDSVVMATRFITPQQWEGTGPTLRRYALVFHPGVTLPPIRDALCPATKPIYAALYQDPHDRHMLITYSDECGVFPRPMQSFVRYYHYIYWPTLQRRTDSLRADLLSRPPAR